MNVRADFPTLHQTVHGRPLVYLDNAATAQKPQAVIERLAAYYRRENSNIHRGVHALSQAATDAYEAARRTVQRSIGAARPEEVVFTRGTTEAINLVAQTWGRQHVGAGDEVVVTTMEHHSNIVPWQFLCEAAGARLRVIPITDAGELRLDAFHDLLSERTRLVALCHVSNALGTVNPVRAMIEDAHAVDAHVLLDGAQAVPHGPVDVQALGADFYAFSGHKVFGPTGVGVLWGRHELLEAMPPWQGGGDMIERVSFGGTTYAPPPHRFEAGTPHIAGGLGLAAALDYVEGVGADAIRTHEQDLLAYATERLEAIDGLRFIGTAREKASVVSFLLDAIHPYDAGLALDRQGIAVRTGHHCTQPLMERLGIEGTIRASFAFYNTRDDVDRLAEGIAHVQREAGRTAAPVAVPEMPEPADDTIEARMDALAEAFEALEEADLKRDFLMGLGDELPPLDEAYRTEQYRVHGCQSAVWLHAEADGGRLRLQADSNAATTRGLIALLVRVLDGQPPEAVRTADLDAFFARIGLPSLISQGRKNGLAAMVKQITLYAFVLERQALIADA